MEGTRGGGADAGSGKGSKGNAGGAKAAGVPNKAALLRAAERKKRLESGFLGREAEVGLNLSFDLPPFWSTSKHGMPFSASGGGGGGGGGGRASASTSSTRASTDPLRQSSADAAGANRRPNSAKPPLRRPGSAAPRAPGAPAVAAEGPSRHRIRETRRRLEDSGVEGASLTSSERSRLVASLPPHEQIVALARGLDASPAAPVAWTGDDAARFRDDPSACVRRAVVRLEARMRAALASAVERENNKSASPAWRERDYLARVFQRVDKKRHGRVTGDCDVGMFMRVWGVRRGGRKKRANVMDDVFEEEDARDLDDGGLEDAEILHDENENDAALDSPSKKNLTSGAGSTTKVTLVPGTNVAAVPLRRVRKPDGRFESVALPPAGPGDGDADVSPNSVAALFCKYGYDKDGFMPYEVFVAALLASPSRLLGMEKLMDAKERDRHGYDDGDDFGHDGKILYPKCRGGVFPPSEFDPELVRRSACAPEAELELEHVYGYAGLDNTSSNLFYLNTGEVVYYTAALGVVLDKDKLEKGKRCQRFFFGHDDDIKSLAVHPNREWVATGQVGKRPFICVWDGVTMLQLQKITHPAGMRGVVALGFSRHDGGDHVAAVNTDNQHTVLVWRWSKGGDDAALERAKNAAAWRFGPEKRVKDRLEFYEKGSVESGAKKAATATPSRAALAAAAAGGAADLETGAMTAEASATAESKAAASADESAWQCGDGTYELVGEGAGMNGLPPMVYGVVWNPFAGMDEFVTHGVKHLKVWRKIDLGDGGGPRWVGELASRNDGRRPADCSAKQARFVNDGNPGGGYVAPPTPDPEDPEYADDFDDDDAGKNGDARRSALEKGKQSLNASMTSLSSFKAPTSSTALSPSSEKKKTVGRTTASRNDALKKSAAAKPPPAGAAGGSAAGLSASVRASFAKLAVTSGPSKPKLPGGGSRKKGGTNGGENVVSVTYARFDVLVTGFPDGALGVWKTTHRDASGASVDPKAEGHAVVRWTCALVQRIAHAHAPGPKLSLPDGTQTYGGVRCLDLRGDGATLLSGGADGWIHTWTVSDGAVAVVGAPRDAGKRGQSGATQPLERVRAVLLNRACKDISAETNGPHSFQFKSPYPNEAPPAMRALDCRPAGTPATGKKRVSSKDKGKTPREFVFGTDKCDVWEVEYKDGDADDAPTIGVQVHGHMADLHAVAAHPKDPDVFASAAEADRVFLWNARDRALVRTAPAGLIARSAAFSVDPVMADPVCFPNWQPWSMRAMGTSGKTKAEKSKAGHHLAIGGVRGGIAVLDGVTLQPLVSLVAGKTAPRSAVDDLKFCGAPRAMLAAGSHDLVVDIYDVANGYAHLSRCRGHQATITNLDWSLPDPARGGRRVLQSTCASYELLYWDPVTGKQILANQRDALWETWSCALGFPVMGIWPDGSDGTDVNAVDRAAVGQPRCVVRANDRSNDSRARSTSVEITAPEGDAGLERAGFAVTADDFGKIKLFNYPCVFNDAPFREYKGHASHAMCARFTCDDRRVLTAGGRDRAMLQFITKGVRQDEPAPAYEPPPPETREWGPIDGGKAMGWIEPELDEKELRRREEERRAAPPKPPPAPTDFGEARE